MTARRMGVLVALALCGLAARPALAGWVVEPPPPTAAERLPQAYSGGVRALIIGNASYESWDDLPGVARDVERVTKLLKALGVPDADVRVVRDLGRQAMLDELERFAVAGRNAGAGVAPGLAIVYYAGHGEIVDQLGYLVPVDAPLPGDDVERFITHAVTTLDAVQKVALNLKERDALFLLDSCFAGIALDLNPVAAVSLRDFAERPRVVQVIAASSRAQAASDDGGFTDRLESGLTGFADANRDGWVTGSELGAYLRGHLAERYRGAQTPIFGNMVIPPGIGRGEVLLAPLEASSGGVAGPAGSPPQDLGEPFRDCDVCPEMVVVPSAPDPDVASGGSVLPAFALGRYEVTFEEWDACFAEGQCTRWLADRGQGRGRMPAVGMSYGEAVEYARWLSIRTGGRYRLPESAEWEHAAGFALVADRSTGARVPTGRFGCRDCGTEWDGRAAPVGSFPRSELGFNDLFGNVWEFTATCRVPGDAGDCVRRVVKGGAFSTARQVIGVEKEGAALDRRRDGNLGFRVLREL